MASAAKLNAMDIETATAGIQTLADTRFWPPPRSLVRPSSTVPVSVPAPPAATRDVPITFMVPSKHSTIDTVYTMYGT